MTNPQAQDWDRFWRAEGSQQFARISWSKKRIINILSGYVAAGNSALDAGCGSGFFSRYFCDQGLATTALDYSDSALTVAGQNTQGRARLLKADLLLDDLGELCEGSFDIIFTDGLFEHFTAVQQDHILANLRRVLAANGVVVTFVPNRFSPWELIRPLYMPGIEETPFVIEELLDLNHRNCLRVFACGGINTLPLKYSPDRWLGRRLGMLLYTVAGPR